MLIIRELFLKIFFINDVNRKKRLNYVKTCGQEDEVYWYDIIFIIFVVRCKNRAKDEISV